MERWEFDIAKDSLELLDSGKETPTGLSFMLNQAIRAYDARGLDVVNDTTISLWERLQETFDNTWKRGSLFRLRVEVGSYVDNNFLKRGGSQDAYSNTGNSIGNS